MKNQNHLRPIFNFFLIVSIATEVYTLLNLKTVYSIDVNSMPWWLAIMNVVYMTYTIVLFIERKWWPFSILMSISAINFAIGNAWTLWMQAVDSSICLAVLLLCLAGEFISMIEFNKDNLDEFKLYKYKKNK